LWKSLHAITDNVLFGLCYQNDKVPSQSS
jgi:hypothetical protein